MSDQFSARGEPTAMDVMGSGGTRICVWDYGGEGPPLLLAHCTGTLGRIWDPVVRRLGGAFRCLSVDTRGHGDSAPPQRREDLSWNLSGLDLLAVIDSLALGDGLFAVGHSAGGAHLAYAALERPGVFRRAVLIDPIIAPSTAFGSENPLSAKVRRRVNHFESRAIAKERFQSKPPMNTWSPDALDAYIEHAFAPREDGAITLKCPGDREAWFYELGGAHDVFERLNELNFPVLLITGSESYVAPLAAAQAGRLPDVQEITVQGAGHFIPQEKPDEVAKLLGDWFR